MRILRLGYTVFPTSKFLDLLELDEIEKVSFVASKNERKLFEDLHRTAKFFGKEDLVKQKAVFNFVDRNLLQKVINRFNRKFSTDLFVSKIYNFKNFKDNYDFVWIGDNGYDGSNLLIKKAKNFFKIPIYRSYKEICYRKSRTEKDMLVYSDKLIFPHEQYLNLFSELYQLDLSNKAYFADLDWRYSKTVEWIKNLEVKKLSHFDKIPHVCILTGQAIWDPSDKLTGNRTYYIDIINDLIKIGAKVHLHALKIVKNSETKPVDENNPYLDLAKTGKLIIEPPLNLYAGSKDYLILKRYDAGILHPKISEELKQTNYLLYKFHQINIPHRFYEYEIADVVPLLEKNSAYYMEQLINQKGFGIVYSDLEDLKNKLWKLLDRPQEKFSNIKTFKDFSKVLIQKK
jgi:hypothetical protein